MAILQSETILTARINSYAACRARFKAIVKLINADTVPLKDQKAFRQWTRQ